MERSLSDYESGREDCKILTFKVNFLCQKLSESFQIFFRSCVQLSICHQKLQNFDFQSQFSMSKIIRILPFFLLKDIKSGTQLILMTLFVYHHFWSTLFTEVGPKFQTLIPNWALHIFCNKMCKYGTYYGYIN